VRGVDFNGFSKRSRELVGSAAATNSQFENEAEPTQHGFHEQSHRAVHGGRAAARGVRAVRRVGEVIRLLPIGSPHGGIGAGAADNGVSPQNPARRLYPAVRLHDRRRRALLPYPGVLRERARYARHYAAVRSLYRRQGRRLRARRGRPHAIHSVQRASPREGLRRA